MHPPLEDKRTWHKLPQDLSEKEFIVRREESKSSEKIKVTILNHEGLCRDKLAITPDWE